MTAPIVAVQGVRPSSTMQQTRLRALRSIRPPTRLQAGLLVVRTGPLLILLILCLAMGALSPFFWTERNLQNLGVQTSIIAALALGELLVIVARGVDISVGSVVALTGVMGITVAASPSGGWLSVLAVMLATGLVVGAVNGVLIVKGRIPQPLIVTVATLGIVRGVALLVSDGGTKTGFPGPIVTAGSGFLGPLPVPVLLVAGLALGLFAMTTKTQWGRWIFAVGGNPDAARRLGVPADRVLISVYVICGCTAAFAGVLTAGRTDSGSPFAGQLLELDAITAVIIGGASLFGGRGSVGNVVVGALILGVIRNGLDLLDVAPFWQSVAIGCVILVALELDALRAALEQRFRSAQGRALS